MLSSRQENSHYHYMTYMATHQHNNPCSRSNEIYNFDRPSPAHHYCKLRHSKSHGKGGSYIYTDSGPWLETKLLGIELTNLFNSNICKFHYPLAWGSCNRSWPYWSHIVQNALYFFKKISSLHLGRDRTKPTVMMSWGRVYQNFKFHYSWSRGCCAGVWPYSDNKNSLVYC